MSVPYAKTVLTDNRRAGIPASRVSPSGGRPVLLAGLGATFISGSAILVKLAGTGAATTTFFRCVLALPVLVALAAAEQRRAGPRPLAARVQAFAAGLFIAVDLVLWVHAIDAVGAGVATVLGNLQVLIVALAAWLLFRERPQRRFLAMLPVVMTGVVLVSGLADRGAATTGGGGLHPLAGIGYGVGTSVAYAVFLLIFRRAATGTPHVATPLAEATAGGAAGSLLLGLAFGSLQMEMPWRAFWWLLLLSVTSQTVGWLLITSSLPRLPAALSSLLLLLQPAAAVLLAAVVLGERPSFLQLTGAVLVCAGVLAASRAAAPGDSKTAARPPGPVAAESLPVPAGPAGSGGRRR